MATLRDMCRTCTCAICHVAWHRPVCSGMHVDSQQPQSESWCSWSLWLDHRNLGYEFRIYCETSTFVCLCQKHLDYVGIPSFTHKSEIEFYESLVFCFISFFLGIFFGKLLSDNLLAHSSTGLFVWEVFKLKVQLIILHLQLVSKYIYREVRNVTVQYRLWC